MKNLSKILVSVICLAAFFTSCVKEEIRIREEIQFDVNLTRAGTTSDQQGDQIQDIMIWAFDLNDQMNCVGWRQYTPPTTTYTSLSLHVPAKTCGTNGGKYRLVAVLNKNTFTDASGNVISLGRNTTYNDLISGKFVSPAVMNAAIEENKPGTPRIMPISHWMDVDVVTANTHENPDATNTSWSHNSVDMPVYRTVAKSQFLMAKKGTNASFDLKVVSLKLINNAMPTDGMILSSVIGDGLSSESATPAWNWGENVNFAPTTSTVGTYTLVDATTEATAANAVAVSKSLENHPAPANGGTVTQDFLNANYASYDLIGSHFIYETTDVVPFVDNSATQPVATDKGYYYEVIYTVDGASYTRYVGLNSQIVRNHDYQVRALVEAGGKLSLSLVVKEWDVDDDNNWNFTDNVSATGRLTWAEGTDVDQVSLGTGTDAEERVTQVILPKTGSNRTNKVECTFTFDTPRDGAKWMASFVGGDVSAFKFIDNDGNLVNTIDGTIDGTQSTLKICTTDDKVASSKSAYLDIVVVTGDGRTLSATAAIFEDNKRPLLVQEATM